MFFPYRIDDEEYGFERWPVATWGIIGLCVIVHATVMEALSPEERENLCYFLGCVPSDFHWWSAFSCTLLHGGWWHLIGNLYFLWIYGTLMERAFGHFRFLLLYAVGAAVSIAAHLMAVSPFAQDVPCIGASGAISAVLGATLAVFPTIRVKFLVVSLIYPRPLPSEGPAWLILGFWFIVQIFYSLGMLGETVAVAFWAHLGGFAAGALFGSGVLWLDRVRQRREIDSCLKLLASGRTPEAEDLVWLEVRGVIDPPLLEALTDTDAERAADRLAEELDRTPTAAAGDGRALALYCRLLSLAGAETVRARGHARAAAAAMRFGRPGLAGLAVYHAVCNRDGTCPGRDRLLVRLADCCRTAGYPETGDRLDRLRRAWMPNARPENG